MTTPTLERDTNTDAPGTLYDPQGKPTALILPEHVENDARLEVPPTLEVPKSSTIGTQTPTYMVAPLWHTTAADDAVDLAEVCGLNMLPWQQLVLRNALGERTGGKWSAFEVGLVLPRQNGKNVIVLARELAGLFLFGEEQQVHTAHKFKTARSAHRELVKAIRKVPDLHELVQSMPTSTDNTAVVLEDGRRCDFLARQNGGGRGLSGDLVILDEAFQISGELVSDLLPTLSARPAPQVWYTSSAGMDSSEVLENLRNRALKEPEKERFLTYIEWSADIDRYEWNSVEACQQANPSLGYFQDWDWISGAELKAMDEERYKRERLGVWADKARSAVIGAEVWQRAAVSPNDIAGHAVVKRSLALEVTEDRDMSILAGAAELDDGRVVVEILDQKGGTAWCAEAAKARYGKSKAWAGVVVDSYSGAAAVAPHLIAAGVPVSMATTRDLTTGTADFYDRLTRKDPDTGVHDPSILHPAEGSSFLDDAAYTAKRRLVGSSKTAWTWAQGAAEVSLAPLRAVTLAVKGLDMEPVKPKRRKRVA